MKHAVNKLQFLLLLVIHLLFAGAYYAIYHIVGISPYILLWRFGGFCLLVLSFYFLCSALCQSKKTKIIASITGSLLFLSLTLLQLLEAYNFLAVGESFGVNFYATMLDFDLIIQLAPSQAPQIAICFLFWSLTTAIFFILMQKAEVPIKCKWQYCSALLLALLTTATYCQQENSLVKFIQMFQLAQAKEVKQLKFSELRKFGISYSSVTKDDLKIVSKGNGKNIILIVLESMEKNFLDEELFPGLTPNLNRLKNSPDSLFFELDNSASCTADAIFQMLYGMPTTPLTIPSSGVGPANIPTLKKFVSLPNIFINAGYSWSHIEQLCSLSELLSQD